MTRAVNDATLQKAGDIYQYLIALRDCFELNDGDTLQIETMIQWEYITVIRDARNMVVHNGGRIYKEFDKYDKFKIGYREEDHQLYLEYNDIVKMYDAILDFMDRTFRIIPQG